MVRLFGCTLRAQLVRRVPALCACTVSALGVCHAHDQLTAPPVRCEKAQSSVLSASFIADAAARASPALVNIAIMHYGQQHSSGSGFIVDPAGLILTNTHVVREAAAQGGAVRVTLSDGATLRGVVETSDAVSDIAIVRVQPSAPLPSVTLGKSENLRPGEFVIALGAPLGLSNSVSFGIVSAVERSRTEIGLRDSLGARNTTAYIQTDAAINSGNSGGPLLNIEGEVIGVNTMKALGMDGIAFAVPIDEVKRVVDQLQRHGRVLRPYLGLKFVELNSSIAAELNSRGQALPSGPRPPLCCGLCQLVFVRCWRGLCARLIIVW